MVVLLRYTVFSSPVKRESDRRFHSASRPCLSPLGLRGVAGRGLCTLWVPPEKPAGNFSSAGQTASHNTQGGTRCTQSPALRCETSLAGEPICEVKLLIKMYLAVHLV